jgi:hypothetical protein
MYQKLQTVFLIIFLFSLNVYSQKTDSTKTPIQFSGSISATNNGVSLIPTFSLGKPAVTFDLAVRGKRLSFEPLLLFAVEKAKPWAFIFWVRYKLIQKEKFKFNVGVHPSYIFSSNTIIDNGIKKEVLTASRYAVAEFVPSYAVSKNTSLGLYYIAAKQIGVGNSKGTQFLALNAISNIKLSEQYFMRLMPQVYYLKLGDLNGFYSNATVVLGKENFPISVSGMVSKSIKTEIEVNKFVWNVGVTYSF